MNPRLFATLCTLVVSTLASAEGSYSNAPAAPGHDGPPAAGGTRPTNDRVPVVGNAKNPTNFPQGLSLPQGSDAAPFAGVPDVSKEAAAPAPGAPAAPPPPLRGGAAAQPPATAEVAPQSPAAQEPPPPRQPVGPPQLAEVFSVEQNPGQGFLNYTHGGQTERIDFGAESGHFAMGMIFRGEYLPDQLGRDFKQKNLFQIALGTLRSKLQGQTPQFGALSILTDGMVEFSARYMLKMPSGQTSKPETGGLLLFTSPNTPVEQTDEEKLKSTYFAQAGTLNLTPEGKAKIVDVRAQSRRLTYRMQLMRLEINGKLVTPFNATEAGLTGVLEFPIYYSEDRAGDLLAKQIARESFGNAGTITVLDDPDDAKREPAAVKKKKPKKGKKKIRRRDDEDEDM